MLTKEERSKIVRRNRRRSYDSEKAAEHLFKARRVGTMGGEDAFNRTFSIETKSFQSPPKALQDWMEQAQRNCPENRMPMVYLHKMRQKRDEDWVIMKVGDFKKVFEKLLELSDPEGPVQKDKMVLGEKYKRMVREHYDALVK